MCFFVQIQRLCLYVYFPRCLKNLSGCQRHSCKAGKGIAYRTSYNYFHQHLKAQVQSVRPLWWRFASPVLLKNIPSPSPQPHPKCHPRTKLLTSMSTIFRASPIVIMAKALSLMVLSIRLLLFTYQQSKILHQMMHPPPRRRRPTTALQWPVQLVLSPPRRNHQLCRPLFQLGVIPWPLHFSSHQTLTMIPFVVHYWFFVSAELNQDYLVQVTVIFFPVLCHYSFACFHSTWMFLVWSTQ